MKKYLFGLLIGVVLCSGGLLLVASNANAGVMITPTRIVFEGRDRFASVTLVNPSSKATTYEMRWSFLKMQKEGVIYVEVDSPASGFDLSKHIVFSPKRVRLAPGVSQKVRLALRRSSEIPDGDHHVRLGFFPVPEVIVGSVPASKSSAAVKIYVGYTIPVILRSGEVNVTAVIDDISLSRNPNTGLLQVAVPVKREGGPYAILGHLMVYHVDENGKQKKVGEISNAHIFPEIDSRLIDVPLVGNITGGSLRIVMYDYKYNKNELNNFIYTERTFALE